MPLWLWFAFEALGLSVCFVCLLRKLCVSTVSLVFVCFQVSDSGLWLWLSLLAVGFFFFFYAVFGGGSGEVVLVFGFHFSRLELKACATTPGSNSCLPAPMKQRQVALCESEASLVYTMSSATAWAIKASWCTPVIPALTEDWRTTARPSLFPPGVALAAWSTGKGWRCSLLLQKELRVRQAAEEFACVLELALRANVQGG